jgi:membrane protein implicated in regulation of membrane protease activity
MMRHSENETVGFSQRDEASQSARRAVAGLLMTGALAIATMVAMMAVTMGMARAAGLTAIVDNESWVFLIALLLGALFIASCLTKAVSPRRNEKRDALRSGFRRGHFPSR